MNPYYDYWVWSCSNLEWAGPDEGTKDVKTSHHILPVFIHHFGCLVPSYESLQIINQYAWMTNGRLKRGVVDIGSGGGYWTLMLRRLGLEVIAVDNQQSKHRTTWIGDTIIADGEGYLAKNDGCRDKILLLVYPVVGANFTARVLAAYKGDSIVVAGTQNRNGFTAFKDRLIDEYMTAEMKDFKKTVQVPLPSFAGKDEALFVFEREASFAI